MLGEYDNGSELVVAVGADHIITVQLHAKGLDASGVDHAAIWIFQDQSVFALADVAVIGYDTIAERRVNGKVSIGLTWNPNSTELSPRVAGTASASGNWTGGLFSFTTLANHSFDTEVIRLISTEPVPTGSTRFSRDQGRTDRKVLRLGSDS